MQGLQLLVGRPERLQRLRLGRGERADAGEVIRRLGVVECLLRRGEALLIGVHLAEPLAAPGVEQRREVLHGLLRLGLQLGQRRLLDAEQLGIERIILLGCGGVVIRRASLAGRRCLFRRGDGSRRPSGMASWVRARASSWSSLALVACACVTWTDGSAATSSWLPSTSSTSNGTAYGQRTAGCQPGATPPRSERHNELSGESCEPIVSSLPRTYPDLP